MLCARFPSQRVAIWLEQPAAELLHALMGHDFIVLYPINPMSLARYREVFTPRLPIVALQYRADFVSTSCLFPLLLVGCSFFGRD